MGGAGGSQPVGRLKLVPCVQQWFDPHLWVGSWDQSSRKDGRTHSGYVMTDESICLDQLDGEGRAMACSGMSRQLWHHNLRTGALVHDNTETCLSISRPPEALGGVSTHECDGSSEQKWIFESVAWN